LKNLKAEMARNGLVIDDIARAIGRANRATASKIRGESPFTFSEAKAVRDEFFPGMSLEYLFASTNEGDGRHADNNNS